MLVTCFPFYNGQDLIVASSRHGKEDGSDNASDDEAGEDTLNEDGILNLAEGGLLNPSLTIKDLSHDVALLVLCDPRLILVRICTLKTVHALAFELHRLVLFVGEEFPRSKVAMVETVQDDTHAFPGSDECGDAKKEQWEGECTPAAIDAGECDEKANDDSTDDARNAEDARKEDAWRIAVADCPADEVGVSLASQGIFNSRKNMTKGRGMCRVLKSVQKSGALLGGEVKLSRAAVGNVDCDDTVDLITERLDGDYGTMASQCLTLGPVASRFDTAHSDEDLQGCHFRPASS